MQNSEYGIRPELCFGVSDPCLKKLVNRMDNIT